MRQLLFQSLNPVRVCSSQGSQCFSQFAVCQPGKRFHIQHQPLQAGDLCAGRRGDARQFKGWGYDGFQRNRLVYRAGCQLGMDGHAVADGEFHLFAVEHAHGGLFLIRVVVLQGAPAAEDGGSIRRADGQLGLEQPDRITQLFGLLLGVHQKEGDHPFATALTKQAVHIDIGVIGVRNPAFHPAGSERNARGEHFHRHAFPDRVGFLQL